MRSAIRHTSASVALWVLGVVLALSNANAAKSLQIYFIDVEGGQSTLVVTPTGETLLIDTGFPGVGEFQATSGDPRLARDANRILAAARDAGVERIDYLFITHFHGDHAGGAPELAQLLPIGTFIDHDGILPEAEQSVPGTAEVLAAYAKVRRQGRHLVPKPGERLSLKGVRATVVSSAGATLAKPLRGAGKATESCGLSGIPAQEVNENPRSTGVLIEFGKFRFLDLGDLTGAPLFALACPNNLIGVVDVYLVAHHGGADAAEPATFAAFKPRVAILNNGANKGGALATFEFLHQASEVGEIWQLHRSNAAGERNFPAAHIANLDEQTAYWIRVSAEADGSFQMLNARTGEWTRYARR